MALGAGEPYLAALVVEVPEAVGRVGGGLHGPVGGFGPGVGDTGLQEAQDLGPPGVDGAGEPLEFIRRSADSPPLVRRKSARRP